jgi:hypothetical protein
MYFILTKVNNSSLSMVALKAGIWYVLCPLLLLIILLLISNNCGKLGNSAQTPICKNFTQYFSFSFIFILIFFAFILLIINIVNNYKSVSNDSNDTTEGTTLINKIYFYPFGIIFIVILVIIFISVAIHYTSIPDTTSPSSCPTTNIFINIMYKILNVILVLFLLGCIYKALDKSSLLDKLNNYSPKTRLFLSIIFYIPCLFVTLFSYILFSFKEIIFKMILYY